MDKTEFLEFYIHHPNRVRMIFNEVPFLQNQTIKITQETICLIDVLNFYVPKFKKNGDLDSRGIELQISDPEIMPLTVREVVSAPVKWDLGETGNLITNITQLVPVPMATDTKGGKTLLLDSSHTIVNIISKTDSNTFGDIELPIIRISGEGLEDIIGDYKILNRVGGSN